MPTTTTIRLPDELKQRVAQAARRVGLTPHAFILDAIAEKAEQQELQAGFDALAEQRYDSLIESGETVPWAEMRAYLQARVAGTPAARPVARKRMS